MLNDVKCLFYKYFVGLVLKIPVLIVLRRYCNRHFTLKCQNEIKIPFDSFSMHAPPAAVNFISTYFPSWFWIIYLMLKKT